MEWIGMKSVYFLAWLILHHLIVVRPIVFYPVVYPVISNCVYIDIDISISISISIASPPRLCFPHAISLSTPHLPLLTSYPLPPAPREIKKRSAAFLADKTYPTHLAVSEAGLCGLYYLPVFRGRRGGVAWL